VTRRGRDGEILMGDVERIEVDEARRHVAARRALLVCAYEDEAKCDRMRLEGAMSLNEFKRRAAMLPKDREIIFDCA
jgi:hypothetical protein